MPEEVGRRVACTMKDLFAIKGDSALFLVEGSNATGITEEANGHQCNIAKVWKEGHHGGRGRKLRKNQVCCVCGSYHCVVG